MTNTRLLAFSLLAGLAVLWSCSSPVGGSDGDQVATPVIDIDAGTYYGAQLVTISCSTAGATIRYTTDGSEPTASSAAYSDFVPVTESMTLKAKAICTGKTDSDIASRALTIHYASSGSVDGAPCYWIDETRHMLPLPAGATGGGVRSMRFMDGEMFVVGVVTTPDTSLPYCWRNDVGSALSTLSGTQALNMAHGLSTVGSDWYIPGDYYSLEDYANHPCYWKNGNLVTLAIPSGYDNGATAEDVNFSGSDILITGRVWPSEGVAVACYWRNGVCTILTGAPTGQYSHAQDILVSGGDVYVTGFVSTPIAGGSYERPCLWKNGQFQYLAGQALASGGYRAGWMYLDGSDLYLGAYIYDTSSGSWIMKPVFWKNGALTQLAVPESTASGGVWGFEKRGSKVIARGDWSTAEGREECYWVDGTYHGTVFIDRSSE